MVTYAWFQNDAKSDNHFLKLGEVIVGYLAKTRGKSGRYLSHVDTPIDSNRVDLYYSGKDLERAKRLTEERVTEFFVAAGLVVSGETMVDFSEVRANGVREITVTTVRPETPREFLRKMSDIADSVIPSHQPFCAKQRKDND